MPKLSPSTGLEVKRVQDFTPSNDPETRSFQHYEILTRPDGSRWELGRGAMGVTYKARDVNLDAPVALKIINARSSARPEVRRRFLHEARLAARLRHPNVASVFHFGTSDALPAPDGEGAAERAKVDAGDCFYAMEFIEGESLETCLRRNGPLSPNFALEIALQVVRALAAAETCGMVHRDLKPSNIMLAGDEEITTSNDRRNRAGEAWVKVIDFGLAKLASEEDEPDTPGHFFGTLAFSSPEQLEARKVDVRSDIYSLGATLWYALTGKVPFALRSRGQRLNLADPPLPVALLIERGIPASVVGLLKSMLAPAPEDRPGSALELSHALQRCVDDLSGADRGATRSSLGHGRRSALAGGLGLAAGLIGLVLYLAPSPGEKSIAVLPFRNLSSDPTNAFFAEGVQDDILSRLVKIRDLKVISRLGASSYPADVSRDLRAIGRTLGVRHLLEGSLRRLGDRVLLRVALIDSRDGHEVWSEGYDRKLADAINLQGELASDIADALDATLSPQERRDVRSQSTHNPDAYVLFLQGRKLEKNPAFEIAAYKAAEALYNQAVVVDPGFALAHARFAITLGLLYRFRGPSEELKARARAEAREALRLQSNLGEAHLAQGLYRYRVERDFERALPELEMARRLLPNDTEAEITIAFIHRRQGQWREALAGQRRALSRDPHNNEYEHELHATACLLRDWPAAAEHADRALALAPKMGPLKAERALVDLWQNGNLVPLQKISANLSGFSDQEGNVAWGRWDAAMLSRDFTAAQAAMDSFPFETLPSVLSAPVPKTYLEGCIWLGQGQNARAQEFFEMARPSMEAETIAHPNDALRHARLGLLYSYMKRKENAVREGKRAIQLTPVAKDAIDGHQWMCNLALIYARVGDADQAIALIKSLLQQPGCVSPLNEASMSLSELRLRWQWDPLRSDPRFQEILAAPEPSTIY